MEEKSEWTRISKNLKNIFSERVDFAKRGQFTPYVKEALSKKSFLLEAANAFGTPLYLLDEDKLVERAKLIKEAFMERNPLSHFFYAVKSNDLPRVLHVLQGENFGADVASLFEMELALKLGVDSIIFTSPTKTEEETRLSIENSDRVVFDVDNFTDLELADRLASKLKPKVPLRLSLRIRQAENQWAKFGFSLKEMRKAALMVMKNPNLAWAGIHFHTSWNTNPDNYVKNIRQLGEFLQNKFERRELDSIKFIDIGGGFIPGGSGTLFSATRKGSLLRLVADFADDKVCLEKPCGIAGFASQICTAFRKNITGPLKRSSWELWVEPGRFVSSFTTYILLKVHSAGEGFVKVNGGINLVGSASFDYEYFPIVNISNPSTQTQKAIIYGPLCDPDDHWGKRYYGRKCKPGDILAVMHQGAYTYSTAWRWQQPTAAYAALRGKKLALVKRQENFEDRYSGCKF